VPRHLRWFVYPFIVLLGLAAIVTALVGIVVILAYPQLPSLEALTDYRPKIPLRVYSADHRLIGEFGEERRDVVAIKDVPEFMKQAIIAAEDERFYQHPGIDLHGILRAAWSNLVTRGRHQGASTITMQVARNFFLSRERTLTRKIYEALLAFKIENNLGKDDILQLYINQIYLGQHAYGFSSAAQIYFGKSLKELSIAEAAMLATLPQAPSAHNPVVNFDRARLRQLHVLHKMLELGFIDAAHAQAAEAETLHIKHYSNDFGVHADYVAEMARQIVVDRFGEDSYSKGYQVITSIDSANQEAAYKNLRKGVLDYDRRHGYRGAENYVDMEDAATGQDEQLEEFIADIDDADDLLAAIVLDATPTRVRAYLRGGDTITLNGDALKFAARMLDAKAPANKRLRRGAVIRVSKDEKGAWQITQLPEAEAAIVAASPIDGAIQALVGGFDFNRSKFNHVTQGWRQPGSSFKPFIYSAAMEKGYTPASVIPDEPIVIPAAETGSQAWEPKNYEDEYDGPMTLRTALKKSKNMVAIRLLRSIGTQYAQEYIGRFGFDQDKHPPYLTMALGAGSVTVWQQLAAYSIFANGGYRIQPHVVKQILDDKGAVLAEFDPPVAGDETLRVIDARNAYLIDSMMHDVTRSGTAAAATKQLKRYDIAGKTGTTNDNIDAWFCGYHPTLVTITWIGFDQPKKLGSNETGAHAALPFWIGFMEQALKGAPESYMEVPEGLTAVDAPDPTSKAHVKELIYSEGVPALPESTEPEPKPQQAPAPVVDARPKPVDKKE
jgi:penicillin-binding protein 1A